MDDLELHNQHKVAPDNRPRVDFRWIAEAWDIYRKGCIPWLVLFAVAGAPLILSAAGLAIFFRSSGSDSSSNTDTDISAILVASGFLLALTFQAYLLSLCSSFIAFRQVQGDTVKPGEIFQGMQRWISMLVLTLILVPALIASTLLFGLGLFVAFGLVLLAFASIADGERGGRAFLRSVSAMKTDWLRASLFCLLITLLAALGIALTFGAGLFVVVPMIYIISALAYRDCICAVSTAPADQGQTVRQTDGVWPPPPTIFQPPLVPDRDGTKPSGRDRSGIDTDVYPEKRGQAN